MYKKALFFSFLYIVGLASLACIQFPFSLRINKSESLPSKMFFCLKGAPQSLKKGNIVGFFHPLSEGIVAKEIAGLPGDCIHIANDQLFIGNQNIGSFITETTAGEKLHPIEAGPITEGYVFVRGVHPRSFDSRYAEFGLLPIEQICEQLWPIF